MVLGDMPDIRIVQARDVESERGRPEAEEAQAEEQGGQWRSRTRTQRARLYAQGGCTTGGARCAWSGAVAEGASQIGLAGY